MDSTMAKLNAINKLRDSKDSHSLFYVPWRSHPTIRSYPRNITL